MNTLYLAKEPEPSVYYGLTKKQSEHINSFIS
jgi:hypothetical protein